jgi:hypothetical protein
MSSEEFLEEDELIDLDNAPAHFAMERWNTCMTCDRLLRATRQCKECGCFMKIKVRLKNSSCPLNKWGPVNS